MTVHESPVGVTVEWCTPLSLFEALGEPIFDLDPAWSGSKYDMVRAWLFYTKDDDGLSREWSGHVWLNPPYGPAGVAFVDRMIAHGDGLLLLPSRTETKVYQRAFEAATAICLLRERLWFVRTDGVTGRSSFGSTLFAFGTWAENVLAAADLGVLIVSSGPCPRCGNPAHERLVFDLQTIQGSEPAPAQQNISVDYAALLAVIAKQVEELPGNPFMLEGTEPRWIDRRAVLALIKDWCQR